MIVGGRDARHPRRVPRQPATRLASTYLTRLKVGPRLVDAAAVPHLYSGRVRPRHLMVVMLAGLVALAAAVAVTPVGQEWADPLARACSDLYRPSSEDCSRDLRTATTSCRSWPSSWPSPSASCSAAARSASSAATTGAAAATTAPRAGGRSARRDFGDEFAAARRGDAVRRRACRPRGRDRRHARGRRRHDEPRSAAQVAAAGGTVAGTYAAQPALVDPGEKSLVDTLGSQLMTQLGDAASTRTPRRTSGSASCSALALATGDGGPTRQTRAAEPGRRGAGRPAEGRQVGRRWSWWCSATDADPRDPGRPRRPASPPRRPASWSAGTPTAGALGGDLVALRADPAADGRRRPSTGSTPPLGQVTATLALIRSLTNPGGSFGASGSDGAVPLT